MDAQHVALIPYTNNSNHIHATVTTIADARIKANQKSDSFKKHIDMLVEQSCKWRPLGSTYFFRTECLNWADARAACKKGGGDLVVITDSHKNARVTAFMKQFNDYGKCNGPYPWLGAYNCKKSGNVCTWVDGSPWSYKGPNKWCALSTVLRRCMFCAYVCVIPDFFCLITNAWYWYLQERG